MPGEATSRTRSEYGPEHLERVRLVRALVEHGGVGIAGVRSVLDAAHRSPAVTPRLPGRGPLRPAHERRRRATVGGGRRAARGPRLAGLARRTGGASPWARLLAAAREAGVTLDATRLRRYAEAMHDVAVVDRRGRPGRRAPRGGDARRRRRHGDGRPGAPRPAAGRPGGGERPAGVKARHPAPDATKARSWWTGPSALGSPDGIRTRATALRGRRARPLHNGAVTSCPPRKGGGQRRRTLPNGGNFSESPPAARPRTRAGVPGLEPRTDEPESPVLPITPYPMGYAVGPSARRLVVGRTEG